MESNANPSMSGKSAAWDLPDCLARMARSGDARLVAEILHDFRTDGAARLARLRLGVAEADASAVRLEAHSIKGSAAQMGATQLANACLALELEARAGMLTHADSHIHTIQTLFDEVCAAMERHPLCAS